MDQKQAKRLGAYLRAHREAAGLSARQLAESVGVNNAQIIRLEQGGIASPKADLLARIAEIIDVPTGELYGLAGYAAPQDLPSFRPYMRAKYGDLPDEALGEIESIFAKLARRHGTAGPRDGEDEK